MIRKRIATMVRGAIEKCKESGSIPRDVAISPLIEAPRDEGNGDYSTNVAFSLARTLRQHPEAIARTIREQMDHGGLCEKVEIAAKGFINFYLKADVYLEGLGEIAGRGVDAFLPDVGQGQKVILEFVSANPTGPLHIGHGRGAAVGDVLASLLEKVGYGVTREYYVNNAGRQILTLGRSVYLRWKELQGEKIEYAPDLYQGEYIREIARELIETKAPVPQEQGLAIAFLASHASDLILDGIRRDLEAFRVFFDNYYPEDDLFRNGKVEATIEALKVRKYLYEEEGALWFKAGGLGDEKDRVVVKSDGEKTYLASDMAYHKDKFERGFSLLIDLWGSDHHGYIPRMKAAIEALGQDPEALKVILIQFVTLLRDGKPVGMSTRSGTFTTLREVLDEVGADVARFFFLMRKSDAHLEFDLDLAKRHSNENPVYYVQYANARIESIFRSAREAGFDSERLNGADTALLTMKEETDLIKAILDYFDVIEGAARSLEPHRLTFYLIDLVGKFHSYYNKARVLGNEPGLTAARLVLLDALRQVIASGLMILGVSVPDRM
jgi:arginyl-tRNA synthetase